MVGFFAVLEPGNQDVMLWGSSPTPVHKLCALAQQTSQGADLASSLNCTLLAVCVYNPRTREVNCGQPYQHNLWPAMPHDSTLVFHLLCMVRVVDDCYQRPVICGHCVLHIQLQ